MPSVRSRRTYSEEEKARAFAVLQINDGNHYRTARDTGIPRSTIIAWSQEWEANGVPEPIHELATAEAKEFVEEAETVRFLALQRIRELIPRTEPQQLQALGNITGILDDKIRLAKGLATTRSEKVLALPPPEELQEKLGALIKGAMAASKQRTHDIDLEAEEQPILGLPAPQEETQ